MRARHSIPIAALAAIAGAAVAISPALGHDGSGGQETVKPQFEAVLPNVPGKKLTSVVVSYPPGAKSPPHKHAGSVYAYVLTGAIRSQNSATGPVKVYHAGDSFFEPAGSVHLVSENASSTAPASLLAIFVADEGAVLTAPAK